MNGGTVRPGPAGPQTCAESLCGPTAGGVELRTENQTGGLMPVPFHFRRHGRSGVEVSELLPRLGRVRR